MTPIEHPFDQALQLDVIDEDVRRGRTDPKWAGMVGPFGGITAATLVRAIETHPHRSGEPIALTVNFTNPIADGEFDISLQTARTNRSTQHWIVKINQEGAVKTTATALFGTRRNTWEDTEICPPAARPPERLTSGGQKAVIAWGGFFDMRFVDGPAPGESAKPSASSTNTFWVRDREERQVDFPMLAALSDVFYPRIFQRLGGVVPAGTISLTIYFHADTRELDALGGDYILATAHANRFSSSFFDQSGQLWTRDGVLLATTHQIVYFKA